MTRLKPLWLKRAAKSGAAPSMLGPENRLPGKASPAPNSIRRRKRPVSGWLVVDKPVGIRSTPLTSRLRWLFAAAKAGHAGTLDEAASGLLAIAFGEATKTIPFLLAAKKTYRFTLDWGRATDSHDREGKTLALCSRTPFEGDIEAALPALTGRVLQTPPDFSAVRVNGKRAWQYARGQVPGTPAPPLKPRPVDIFALRLISHSPEQRITEMEALTGKGVYIRAIARDLGAAVGIPVHIAALRRTRLGAFTTEHSYAPDRLAAIATTTITTGTGGESEAAIFRRLDGCLEPFDAALAGLPRLALPPPAAAKLRQGQKIPSPEGALPPREKLEEKLGEKLGENFGADIPLDLVPAMGENKGRAGRGRFVLAVCRDFPAALAWLEAGQLKPVRVFNPQPPCSA